MEQYEVRENSVFSNGMEIPIIWKGEVAVIGGGTAGVTAAVASVRKKIPVLIIEKNSYFGGALSDGGGRPADGAFPADVSLGGVMDEILARLRFSDYEPAELVHAGQKGTLYYYDNELYKKLADEFLVKSGCSRMLNTVVTDVLASRGRIWGLIVSCNMRKGAILANAFIDSTHDGSVADALGIPVTKDEEAGRYAYPYILTHVDTKKVKAYLKKDPDLKKAMGQNQMDGIDPNHDLLWNLQLDICQGTAYADTIRIVGSDGFGLGDATEAEIKARGKLFDHIRFFRSCVPGMEECRLYRCAQRVTSLGGSRVEGVRFVTEADCAYGEHLKDGIVRCQAYGGAEHSWYELPFGVMAVSSYENLLVTGNAISVDGAIRAHMGLAVRMSMGQCAGIAAAAMALQKIKGSEVNGALMRSMLDEVGCDVDGDKSRVFREAREIQEIGEVQEAREAQEAGEVREAGDIGGGGGIQEIGEVQESGEIEPERTRREVQL